MGEVTNFGQAVRRIEKLEQVVLNLQKSRAQFELKIENKINQKSKIALSDKESVKNEIKEVEKNEDVDLQKESENNVEDGGGLGTKPITTPKKVSVGKGQTTIPRKKLNSISGKN